MHVCFMIQLMPDAPQRYLLNLKGRAVLLHSWSPIEAITTGPLSLFTERGEHCGGRGGGGWWRGARDGGKEEGRERRNV